MDELFMVNYLFGPLIRSYKVCIIQCFQCRWNELKRQTTGNYWGVCVPSKSFPFNFGISKTFLFIFHAMIFDGNHKVFLEGCIRDHSMSGVRGCMQSPNRKKLPKLNGPPPPAPSTTMQGLLFNIHVGANRVISFLLFYHFTWRYPLAIRCLPE